MKTVSNNFKAAAIAPVKQSGATVTVYNSDDTTTVYSASDYLQSVSIEATGELFGTYASTATFNLLGTNYDHLLNLDIDIQYFLVVEGDDEYIDYGSFLVTDVQTDFKKQTTTVKAISQMLQLQAQDYSPIEGFPMTVEQMTQKIATDFGLTLASMSTLPNVSQTIQEDLYANISGANYRNILGEIAGTTGTMAIIDRVTNTLSFRPYESTVQQALDYTYLRSFTSGLPYGPVNALVLARTPQEDNIVVQDDQSVEDDGLTEVKLANNEIMDDDRTAFITPLFNAIKGMEWNGFEINTVGLGWLECGDRVSITDENNDTIEGIITYIKLTFDGGIKELIKAVPPVGTTTNYALAGGITKTIYNTEIKVDKQNQRIESIVEEQTNFQNQTINNFTNVTQNINSVVTSVQASGGSNLIKNSAFFTSDDNGRFTEWTYGQTNPTVETSGEAMAYGSLSGQIIHLDNLSIVQVVTVKADDSSISEDDKTFYSFSCRAKKSSSGTASITLSDGTETGVWTIPLPNGEAFLWKELYVDAILPNSNSLTITVQGSASSDFAITDMMLSVGNYHTQWQQASGESNNTQVSITTDGITVKNGNTASTWAKHTNQSFDVYKNRQIISAINSDEVKAPRASFTSEIDMPPLKIVPQSDGWAFVKFS